MPSWVSVFALCALWVTACSNGAMRDVASMAPASYDFPAAEGDAEPGAVEAPASTWKRSTLSALTSRLTVGDHEALPLASTEIQARVDAFRARVMIDFVFENPHSRTLEGTFQLRLPEGASPYFLAYGETVKTAAAAEPERLQIAADEDAFAPAGAMAARAGVWQQPRQAIIAER
ncbi:MAG: hypothetical protein AAF721_24250, partial [Myxococcota bacterium]